MLYNLVEEIVQFFRDEGIDDITVNGHSRGYSIHMKDKTKLIRLRMRDEKKVIITIFLNGYDNSVFTYFVDIQNDPTNNYPYHKPLYIINSDISPFKNNSVILTTAYTFNLNKEYDDLKCLKDEIHEAVHYARKIENSGLDNNKNISKHKESEQKKNNVEEKPEETETESKYYDINTARERIIKAKDFLESKMVGQDEYIKHVCYILMQILTGEKVDNTFFIGKSGSGKTYAWELLCKDNESPIKDILGYELIDASTITAEGYIGCNLSQALTNLEDKISEKKYFILIIDEFDKVLIDTSHRNYDRELQQGYLQILAHGEVRLNKEYKKSFSKETIDFTNIPLVLLGAFQNYDFYHKTPNRKTIGFLESDESNDLKGNNNQSISEEILNMGGMPELVGRITNFHLLNVLDESILRDKLKGDIVDTAREITQKYNVGVEINNDVADLINIEEDFGARSIKTCLNKIFNASVMYDVSVEGSDVMISLDENNNIIHSKIKQ